jgi:3-phenylpropionate/trans-cinnamate dioxygenase ferredoxin reductase subunit
MTPSSIVIVGASLAGVRAAETMRRAGFGGPLTLIGDEAHPPYDRPPLSKQVLAGTWEPERTRLQDDAALAELGLDLRLGVRASGFDAGDRVIALADGSEVRADGVMIATGARARTLPGADGVAGVYTLRTLDDCLALRAELAGDPRRVAVVGAGFIGAEVAATARERGHEVTMIEAAAAPLDRVLPASMGTVCAEIHAEHGVDVRLGIGVAGLEEGAGRVAGVRLADGSAVAADIVVIGIGVVPNTDWLEGSGLSLDNGVVCDETCLAAPGVVGAGDVARWPNPTFDGELMRVEHWDNAVDQGMHAALRLLAGADRGEPFGPVPWFWSDQYDRKIQLAGRPRPDDEVVVVNGSIAERRFAALFGRGGRVVAVLGMNRPRQVMQFRGLIANRASWDDALAVAAATP